VFLFLRL